jgi:hypothetical protein
MVAAVQPPGAMVAAVLALVLCATAAGATTVAAPRLVPATSLPASDPASAAILIGGIDDSGRAWPAGRLQSRPWTTRVSGSTTTRSGRTSRRTRSDSRSRLLGLSREVGVRRLSITAYSMGDGSPRPPRPDDRGRTIAEFEPSSSWSGHAVGGFERANIAWHLRFFRPGPGLRSLARDGAADGFRGRSATPFIHALRAPLPAHVAFYVCEGGADEVATPRTWRSTPRTTRRAAALARRRIRIPGANHRDMSVPRRLDLDRGHTGLSASIQP